MSLHNRNKDAKIDLFIDQKHFPCSKKRETTKGSRPQEQKISRCLSSQRETALNRRLGFFSWTIKVSGIESFPPSIYQIRQIPVLGFYVFSVSGLIPHIAKCCFKYLILGNKISLLSWQWPNFKFHSNLLLILSVLSSWINLYVSFLKNRTFIPQKLQVCFKVWRQAVASQIVAICASVYLMDNSTFNYLCDQYLKD